MDFEEETRPTWDGTPLPRRISLPFTFRAGADLSIRARRKLRARINQSPGAMGKRNDDTY
jgi:hypothetical protein